MTTYLLLIDYFWRNTILFDSFSGIFLASGVSACLGWILVWPYENLKSIVQTDSEGKASQLRKIYLEGGVKRLYRGITPGLVSSFSRNGFSMIAMLETQKAFSTYGLR